VSNAYSSQWFDLFLRTIPLAQTEKEVDFLRRVLPDPPFHRLLDICCGEGRHAIPLAARGYDVSGIDLDEAALAVARSALDSRQPIHCDVREMDRLAHASFDAAICLWQSFGYFDEPTNVAVLRAIGNVLRPGGRLVLDVYHREFFERNVGTRLFEKGGRHVTESKRMTDNRLHVTLDYGEGRSDQFDWQLFTPEELAALAASVGLRPVLTCSDFDERIAASADRPRFQVVLQNR
jgi:SAM-dependent methyltransferase